jgi:hypothetical protein
MIKASVSNVTKPAPVSCFNGLQYRLDPCLIHQLFVKGGARPEDLKKTSSKRFGSEDFRVFILSTTKEVVPHFDPHKTGLLTALILGWTLRLVNFLVDPVVYFVVAVPLYGDLASQVCEFLNISLVVCCWSLLGCCCWWSSLVWLLYFAAIPSDFASCDSNIRCFLLDIL